MKLYSKIIRLGMPILISQLGMIVVGFADNAMVGHYSTDALAAASFVNNIFNIPILMCLGFSFGLTPLIGALFSRDEDHNIGSTLRRGLIVNIVFSLIVTAVMGLLYFNLDNMGQPAHLMPLIKPYFLLYLSGIISISIYQSFSQWAYAINSTKMPMWIMLASNVINIFGNYVLIFGKFGLPEMGLLGAGISTIIARWFCPAVIIAIFIRGGRYRRYHAGFRHAGGTTSVGRIVATSIPVSLQMGFETACFSLSAVMAGWLGHIELASLQIIIIIGTLGFSIYYGIAAAVSVLVANAAGNGDTRLMKRTALAGYRIILVLATISSLIFVILGRHFIMLFTSDPAVIATTATLIMPLIAYQLGDATQITFANALRGTSRVKPMVWIAFISYVVIGLPSTYLIAFTFSGGIVGIVMSYSISLFCAGTLFLTFFLRTVRKMSTI